MFRINFVEKVKCAFYFLVHFFHMNIFEKNKIGTFMLCHLVNQEFKADIRANMLEYFSVL
jgi:hypothetical protein